MSERVFHRHSHTLQHSLRRINKVHRGISREHFKEIGLSSGQPKVLQYLSRHDGCSQKDLAKHCHIQPATATSLLHHLEKEELIYRVSNEQDRRVTNVYLTSKGKALQKQVEQILGQIDEQCLTGFTEDEKEQLGHYLERIYQNLKVEEPSENE